MTPTQNLKWWGWGLEGQTYPMPDPQGFWSFLKQTLGPLPRTPRIFSLDGISLEPPRLTAQNLLILEEIFRRDGVTTSALDRLGHSLGKSYVDLWRIRQGQIETVPDAVIFPEREKDIKRLLSLAVDQGWVIIPFGGGTSVVGGIEPPVGSRPVLTLDLRRLDRVVTIDRESNTACIQAGIRGPELEAELNTSGFTLGHFPQSFEYSTLGGWVATRGAGQNSTKYGKIEQMVVSVRMVTPSGVLDSPVVPADAAGPSLLQCLVGSEGTLGVITRVVVRVHPVPEHRAFACYLFPDFASGMRALRGLLQADICPAVLRLSDPNETHLALLLNKSPHPSIKERCGEWYARSRGFELKKSAMLILIFEGSHHQVSAAKLQARRFLKSGLNLGPLPARMWMKSRFLHPYLRDHLLERSVMVDTLETSAPWNKLPQLYVSVRQVLFESILKTASGALVLCHLSHAYRDGASLYFIFMARQQPGHELEQWQTIKTAATETILKHGGALSHHHGVGSIHKPWIRDYLGLEGLNLLKQLKKTLDPHNVMNPGKLMGS